MKIIRGNIFYPHTYYPKTFTTPDAICISTNGYTRADGQNVMGRGLAAQAAKLFPKLPKLLGSAIQKAGNNVHCFDLCRADFPFNLLAFPVKPAKDAFNGQNIVAHMAGRYLVGENIPGWACKAQLSIIKRSCKQLLTLVEGKKWETIVIPRVGCGAGELTWPTVRPILDKLLDDRFYCITAALSCSDAEVKR
jgi:hypothetical protein